MLSAFLGEVIASFLFGVPRNSWLLLAEIIMFALIIYIALVRVQNLWATLLPIPVIIGIRFLTTQFSKASEFVRKKKFDLRKYASALDVALKRRGVKAEERRKIIEEVFRIKLKR